MIKGSPKGIFIHVIIALFFISGLPNVVKGNEGEALILRSSTDKLSLYLSSIKEALFIYH